MVAAKGSNKEHIAGNHSKEVSTSEGRMDMTKSGKAFSIFDEMTKENPDVTRKECLDRAIAEADMTMASAATFYQKWRDERGMVHRDPPAPTSSRKPTRR